MKLARNGNFENKEENIINQVFIVICQINKELQNNNILNLNYLLLNMSNMLSKDASISKDELLDIVVIEINRILLKYSNTFKIICDKDNFYYHYLLIDGYMRKVLKYYDNLMMTNQDKFDRYVEITNGNMPKKKIIKSENLYMTLDDIQNTMHLLNEAVRNYYEIYYKKTVLATFTDEQIIQFKIKESELAHLLGVNLKKIVNNSDYVSLFHITQQEIQCINDTTYTLDPTGSAAVEILHKIIDLSNGNLLQFEEDRLRKIKNYAYKTIEYDTDDETLRNYSKMNMRSKAFINFQPLEELSLALNFPEGYKIIKESKKEDSQHSLLVSKNNLSEHFKYSTLIANFDKNTDRRYFESLFLRKPEELEQLQKDSIPAITISVEISSDDGSGGVRKDFSVSEQIQFLEEVQADFSKLNLEGIVDYFYNVINGYNNSSKKGM